MGGPKIFISVRSGDNLGSIARRYAVRVSDIQKWNKLSSTLIRTGQNLAIWTLPSYAKEKSKSVCSGQSEPEISTGNHGNDLSGQKGRLIMEYF